MTTKQAIAEAIEQLPEQHLAEVLKYIQQLASIQTTPTRKPSTPISDPLVDFIGAISHGSLATNLDSELYGKEDFH